MNVKENDPEKKVDVLIKFLPILAYDGSSMKEIDAKGILDIVMTYKGKKNQSLDNQKHQNMREC